MTFAVVGCQKTTSTDTSNLAVVVETSGLVEAEEVRPPSVEITLTGAKSQIGVYSCAIFSNREDFEERTNPVRSEQIAAATEPAVWSIQELAGGEYTVAVFHDENENGKLDRHAFGYPTETYGFSNNARGKLGPPAYEKVVFELVDGETSKQSIRLK